VLKLPLAFAARPVALFWLLAPLALAKLPIARRSCWSRRQRWDRHWRWRQCAAGDRAHCAKAGEVPNTSDAAASAATNARVKTQLAYIQ